MSKSDNHAPNVTAPDWDFWRRRADWPLQLAVDLVFGIVPPKSWLEALRDFDYELETRGQEFATDMYWQGQQGVNDVCAALHHMGSTEKAERLFAEAVGDIKDKVLGRRRHTWCHIFNADYTEVHWVRPAEFLTWARQRGVDLPRELEPDSAGTDSFASTTDGAVVAKLLLLKSGSRPTSSPLTKRQVEDLRRRPTLLRTVLGEEDEQHLAPGLPNAPSLLLDALSGPGSSGTLHGDGESAGLSPAQTVMLLEYLERLGLKHPPLDAWQVAQRSLPARRSPSNDPRKAAQVMFFRMRSKVEDISDCLIFAESAHRTRTVSLSEGGVVGVVLPLATDTVR